MSCRTPLSTVLGYAETLAEEDDLPPDLRSNFGRTIRDEARRMLRIIEDLMSLSRIEADRFVAPAEQVEIAAIVDRAMGNAGHRRRGGRSSAPQYPRRARTCRRSAGDRAQLIQVLRQSDQQRGPLRLRQARSLDRRCSATQRGVDRTVSVTDHGPGIAREHLPRDDRALLSGRRCSQPRIRRHRPWPRDRQAHRRAPPGFARHQEHARGWNERYREAAGGRPDGKRCSTISDCRCRSPW